jgi:hypothetical protein
MICSLLFKSDVKEVYECDYLVINQSMFCWNDVVLINQIKARLKYEPFSTNDSIFTMLIECENMFVLWNEKNKIVFPLFLQVNTSNQVDFM